MELRLANVVQPQAIAETMMPTVVRATATPALVQAHRLRRRMEHVVQVGEASHVIIQVSGLAVRYTVIAVAVLTSVVLEAATQETVILIMGVLQSTENVDHCLQATKPALEHSSATAVVSTATAEAQVIIVPAATVFQEPAQRDSHFVREQTGLLSR
jgi:hypothetical protein